MQDKEINTLKSSFTPEFYNTESNKEINKSGNINSKYSCIEYEKKIQELLELLEINEIQLKNENEKKSNLLSKVEELKSKEKEYKKEIIESNSERVVNKKEILNLNKDLLLLNENIKKNNTLNENRIHSFTNEILYKDNEINKLFNVLDEKNSAITLSKAKYDYFLNNNSFLKDNILDLKRHISEIIKKNNELENKLKEAYNINKKNSNLIIKNDYLIYSNNKLLEETRNKYIEGENTNLSCNKNCNLRPCKTNKVEDNNIYGYNTYEILLNFFNIHNIKIEEYLINELNYQISKSMKEKQEKIINNLSESFIKGKKDELRKTNYLISTSQILKQNKINIKKNEKNNKEDKLFIEKIVFKKEPIYINDNKCNLSAFNEGVFWILQRVMNEVKVFKDEYLDSQIIFNSHIEKINFESELNDVIFLNSKKELFGKLTKLLESLSLKLLNWKKGAELNINI